MNFSAGILIGIVLAVFAFQYKLIVLNKQHQQHYSLIIDSNSTALSVSCENPSVELLPNSLAVSQYERLVLYFQSTNVGLEIQEKHPVTQAKLWRQWITAQPTTFRYEFQVYSGMIQFQL